MFKKSLPLGVILSLSITVLISGCTNAQDEETLDNKTQEKTTQNEMMQDKEITNEHWWPNRLDLTPLRQNAEKSDPMGKTFDYAEEFKSQNAAA